MALRSVISSKLPMVIILGATGTGKTKLGIELAQKYGTEIISADSMQIYKGLDIVTAKASLAERELVPHHLLDILEPHQNFTVVDFRNRALEIIDKLSEQGKIPIIVGGTNYYIESIVYNILVEDMSETDALLWEKSKRKRDYKDVETKDIKCKKQALGSSVDCSLGGTACTADRVKVDDFSSLDIDKLKEDVDNEEQFTNDEILERLRAVDPVMASRLHPNNRRKVLRSIEVWLKTGRRHSEVLDEQKLTEGQLRKPGATIILWLRCEQKVHDERLEARVDAMIKDGLMDELLGFHDRHNKHRIQDDVPPDYTKGVFQTLGFKEFHEYLIMSDEEKQSDAGKNLLEDSIKNMKLVTKRYARRQNKMVLGRFLEIPKREVPVIYELDTTNLTEWDDVVKNKAIHIIDSFMNNEPCKLEPLKPQLHEEKRKIDGHSSNFCELCKRLIIGDKEYAIHLQSNKHKRVLKKLISEKKIENKETPNV